MEELFNIEKITKSILAENHDEDWDDHPLMFLAEFLFMSYLFYKQKEGNHE